MVAGLILVSRDWCWSTFLQIDHVERDWALSTLAKYVQEGDGAPQVLQGLRTAKEKKDDAHA
jgi:hypothetical protein